MISTWDYKSEQEAHEYLELKIDLWAYEFDYIYPNVRNQFVILFTLTWEDASEIYSFIFDRLMESHPKISTTRVLSC